jgi:hypothetical protein
MRMISRVLYCFAVVAWLPGCGADPAAPEHDPYRIELFHGRRIVEVKGQIVVQAVAYGSGNWALPSLPLTWMSDDPSIASVEAGGRVTGHHLGTVTIRASWKDIQGAIAIDVRPASLRITLQSGPETMLAGETAVLKAEPIDAEGGVIPTSHTVEWVTGETGVLSLSSVNQSTVEIRALSRGLASVGASVGGIRGNYVLAVLDEPMAPDAPVHVTAFQLLEFQNLSEFYAYGPGIRVTVDAGRSVEIKRVEAAFAHTDFFPALCSSGRLTAGQYEILTANDYPSDVYNRFSFFSPQRASGVALLTYTTDDGKTSTAAVRGSVTLMGFPFGPSGVVPWKVCTNAS